MNYHPRKRHPGLRITFLLFTVAAVALTPVAIELHEEWKVDKPVARSEMPLAGQTYHIAGQEEVDEDDPSGIVLRAQEDAEVGELVRLDATESSVDSLTWQIIPATEDFEVIEDGRRAFFSSRIGGTYLIIIAAAKDGKAFLRHHTITVIGEEPEPGPENLKAKTRRWFKNVGDYEGRQVHAIAVAQVFRKLAAADEIDVDGMLEATATANSAVLGDSIDHWIPFLEPLGAELDAITAAGGLSTRDQYKTIWISIAEGIEAGAK